MPPPSPLPTYVYKIVPDKPPAPIPEAYPLSDLDRNDGFIHLSTPAQIPITSDLFFSTTKSFYLFKIPLSNLPAEKLKWEEAPGTGRYYPHLYGNFGAKEILDVKEFVRNDEEGQTWSEVFAADSWLE
ncbi:hypothetical protein QBC35DRAFT_486582 [Podospora australis]|uniref:DUF952 domain-containing protein n=1 Tax=Podospora australis TaxID=1536484 RepID=A0AAN7AMI9_9PEZI|nr:hypothetical protein QBC35DRAFT_486582 [Podospora australis]